jgi:hypothetical protein
VDARELTEHASEPYAIDLGCVARTHELDAIGHHDRREHLRKRRSHAPPQPPTRLGARELRDCGQRPRNEMNRGPLVHATNVDRGPRPVARAVRFGCVRVE